MGLAITISGVDQALWDIKGRQAACRSINRRKVREAADCYGHASGAISSVVESAKGYMKQGFRHVRIQIGVPGMSGYGGGGAANVPIKALHDKPVYEPAAYIRRALKMFEVCRKELGDEVELLHDVHERISPNQAVQFCKDAEKFKLFFVEDPLSPEDIAYFRRFASSAPPHRHGRALQQPARTNPLIESG
jgi:mannonate dehydratase